MSTESPALPKEHYLSRGWDLKSWLLTTDHKRIGLLYLVSITLMFALGSFYAALVRWNLLVPDGSHMTAEAYNKAFTGHGVIMVFFFLIPSIPATLGNFLIPLMIGAKDLAFPRINLLSWYVYMIGAGITLYALLAGGLDTGWTFYTPYSTVFAQSNVELAAIGIFVDGLLLDPDRAQLHRHHPHDAGAGDDLVPHAALRVGPLRDLDHPGPGDAGGGDHDPARGPGADLPLRLLRPQPRRRPDPLPAPVLVLLAPGRLHHDPALDGGDQRDRHLLLAQAHLRLQLHRDVEPRDRRDRLPGLGPPHVRVGHGGVLGDGLLRPHLPGGRALRDQDLQLDGDALPRLGAVGHADDLRVLLHRPLPDRRADRPLPGQPRHRRPPHRHLLRGRPLPLHHGGRGHHGVPGRPALLVAQDHRAQVHRVVGQDLVGPHLRRLQPHVLPAVHPRLPRHAAALPRLPRRVPGAERPVDRGGHHPGLRLPLPVLVPHPLDLPGRAGRSRSLGGEGPRVDDQLAPAHHELRRRSPW